jgi:hypothetical protein
MSLHGAHVSGIVAAKARTIRDRLGIAPKAKLFFRALTTGSQGTVIYYTQADNNLARKITHSKPSLEADKALASFFNELTAKGARLINASFVFTFGPQSLEAFKAFARNGGVLIKAAGNSGIPL